MKRYSTLDNLKVSLCHLFRVLMFVNRSLGAAQAIVGIHNKPDISQKLSGLVLLSPALFLKRPDNATVQFIMDKIPGAGYRIAFPIIALAQCLTPEFILLPFSHWAMYNMGWYRSPIGWEASKTLFAATPSSGTSTANMLHWVNLSNSNGNISFDSERISCPTFCYVGSEDDVIDAIKTKSLIQNLPDLRHFHCEPKYGHTDFVSANPLFIFVHLLIL